MCMSVWVCNVCIVKEAENGEREPRDGFKMNADDLFS